MSAVTLAELSRLREADIIASNQLVDAITAELRLALGHIIPKSQQYIEAPLPRGHELLVVESMYVPKRTRLIGIEPFTGNALVPSALDVELYSMPAARMLRVSDDILLSPTQGQLIIHVQGASIDDAPLLAPITTRALARGIVRYAWATGSDIADATTVLWDVLLAPLEDLRQRMRLELEIYGLDEAS